MFQGSRLQQLILLSVCVVLVGGVCLSFAAQPNLEDQDTAGADMKVTRINQFPAKPGSGDELFELIGSFLPLIRSSDGCLDVQLLRGVDDPDKIVVIEIWRDQEAHQASAKNVPPGTFEKAMALMADPPSGAYYH